MTVKERYNQFTSTSKVNVN